MGTEEKNPNKEEFAKVIVGKHVDYYLTQFEEIRKVGKSKFNCAAFFFGFSHAAYRGVVDKWLRYIRFSLLIPMEQAIIAAIFYFCGRYEYNYYVGKLSVFFGIIYLICQFHFARDFNQVYKNHVQRKIFRKDGQPDPSVKRAVKYTALFCLFLIAVTSITQIFVEISREAYIKQLWEDYSYISDKREENYLQDSSELAGRTSISERNFVWNNCYERTTEPEYRITITAVDDEKLCFSIFVESSYQEDYVYAQDYVAYSDGYVYMYEDKEQNYMFSIVCYNDQSFSIYENTGASKREAVSGDYRPASGFDSRAL